MTTEKLVAAHLAARARLAESAVSSTYYVAQGDAMALELAKGVGCSVSEMKGVLAQEAVRLGNVLDANTTLGDAMVNLVKYATDEVNRLDREGEADVHHSVCTTAAHKFHLFDDEGLFPVWLSRVVEGVIRDIEAERR